MKRLIDFLLKWDGLWSAPLLGLMFLAFSVFASGMFGQGVATYDPGIIQSLLLTATIIVAFNFFTLMGIRFNFAALYRYYETIMIIEFYKLTPWQRFLSFLGIYLFFFCSFLFVLQLVL